MSKRHQATRRRSYGKRQHEMHQRQNLSLLAAWLEREDEPRETTGTPEPWLAGERATRRLGLGYGD
jgi:hypothetical protein